MLLKKTSSSWSLSKSAVMTVRTGDGMENLGVAMSCAKDRNKVTRNGTHGPTMVLQVPFQLGIGAQSQIEVKPGPQPRGLSSKAGSAGGASQPQPSPGIGHVQEPRSAGRGGAAHSSFHRQCPAGHHG